MVNRQKWRTVSKEVDPAPFREDDRKMKILNEKYKFLYRQKSFLLILFHLSGNNTLIGVVSINVTKLLSKILSPVSSVTFSFIYTAIFYLFSILLCFPASDSVFIFQSLSVLLFICFFVLSLSSSHSFYVTTLLRIAPFSLNFCFTNLLVLPFLALRRMKRVSDKEQARTKAEHVLRHKEFIHFFKSRLRDRKR